MLLYLLFLTVSASLHKENKLTDASHSIRQNWFNKLGYLTYCACFFSITIEILV